MRDDESRYVQECLLSMRKYIFLAIVSFFLIERASAEGWTPTTSVTSVGQYGQNAIFFTTEDAVGECANKNKFYYRTSDASDPEKFYSALLTAFTAGKKIKFFLHNSSNGGPNCGGENAQQIVAPNYYYISN